MSLLNSNLTFPHENASIQIFLHCTKSQMVTFMVRLGDKAAIFFLINLHKRLNFLRHFQPLQASNRQRNAMKCSKQSKSSLRYQNEVWGSKFCPQYSRPSPESPSWWSGRQPHTGSTSSPASSWTASLPESLTQWPKVASPEEAWQQTWIEFLVWKRGTALELLYWLLY